MNKFGSIFAPMAFCMTLASFPVLASSPAATSVTHDMIQEINQARKQKGRKSLKPKASLMRAAQKQADELASRGYGTILKRGGHIGKNGSTNSDRIRRAGYKACTSLENLAWGQKSAEEAVTAWMVSAGHRKNLLNRKIRDIGVGFAPPKTWVMVGARPC
tara:strand:- start:1070 stop:1549 length:480 start_codon:yes stop_codon:yes gene_type:complete